ncbi:unnamed protein product, partial [Iphiclides podalirius]
MCADLAPFIEDTRAFDLLRASVRSATGLRYVHTSPVDQSTSGRTRDRPLGASPRLRWRRVYNERRMTAHSHLISTLLLVRM